MAEAGDFSPPDDSPQLRAELRARLQQVRQLESSVSAFAVGVAELSTSLSNTGLDPEYVKDLLSPTELGALHVGDTFTQLGDFAENLQHQLSRLVVDPLREYAAACGAAARQAKAFDDESEALDAAHAKYLSLSKDSPIETRVYAHQELCDRAAGASLSLFDAKAALREGCAGQRVVPQRAVCELLVAQLAYHQSCTRLLTSVMPRASELLAAAEGRKARLDDEQARVELERAAMPRPQVRDGGTIKEGWMYKGTFALSHQSHHHHGVKQLSRLKPWNKRWFVLCDDGKLYYYKGREDAQQAKVPVDMNLLTAVTAVNGPLEFELRVGERTLRLKATEPAERAAWMEALNGYLNAHTAEREAAAAANRKRYMEQGRGIRDVGEGRNRSGSQSRTAIEGWLYRQDADMMRRWRKWWCEVEGGELVVTSYDTLKITDKLPEPRDRPSPVPVARANSQGGSRPARDASTSPAAAPPPAAAAAATSTHSAAASAPPPPPDDDDDDDDDDALLPPIDAPLGRVSGCARVPLATATVREARNLGVPYAFEVISPQLTLTLQSQSQEEMSAWVEVIQNATARELGCNRVQRMSISISQSTVFGRLRLVAGNQRCADCADANPAWASINMGVLVCLACAGVHRQLGTHITKVRSLELDTKEWSVPLVAVMSGLGNAAVNRLWQPGIGGGAEGGAGVGGAEGGAGGGAGAAGCGPLSKASSSAERERHIRFKYEARGFIQPGDAPPPVALHAAALADDVLAAARSLARSAADVDAPAPTEACDEWSAEAAEVHGGRSALQVAAAEGSETVLELLLQNLARSPGGVDATDPKGKTALKLAVEAGEAGCVGQLVTRGANISAADGSDQTPMQAAAELGHDEIVEVMLQYKLAQDEKLLRQVVVD